MQCYYHTVWEGHTEPRAGSLSSLHSLPGLTGYRLKFNWTVQFDCHSESFENKFTVAIVRILHVSLQMCSFAAQTIAVILVQFQCENSHQREKIYLNSPQTRSRSGKEKDKKQKTKTKHAESACVPAHSYQLSASLGSAAG